MNRPLGPLEPKVKLAYLLEALLERAAKPHRVKLVVMN